MDEEEGGSIDHDRKLVTLTVQDVKRPACKWDAVNLDLRTPTDRFSSGIFEPGFRKLLASITFPLVKPTALVFMSQSDPAPKISGVRFRRYTVLVRQSNTATTGSETGAGGGVAESICVVDLSSMSECFVEI